MSDHPKRRSSVDGKDGATICVRAHTHIQLRNMVFTDQLTGFRSLTDHDGSRYPLTIGELNDVSDILARLCGEIQIEGRVSGAEK